MTKPNEIVLRLPLAGPPKGSVGRLRLWFLFGSRCLFDINLSASDQEAPLPGHLSSLFVGVEVLSEQRV